MRFVLLGSSQSTKSKRRKIWKQMKSFLAACGWRREEKTLEYAFGPLSVSKRRALHNQMQLILNEIMILPDMSCNELGYIQLGISVKRS